MRIAVYHDLPRGGAYYMVAEYAKRLSTQHEVMLFWICNPTVAQHYPPITGVSATRRYDFCLTPPPRSLHGSPWTPIDLLRLDLLNRRIARDIDASSPDVVLAFASRHTQAPLVLRHLRTPSVYFCTEPLRIEYEPDTHPLRKARLRHVVRTAITFPFRRLLRDTEHRIVSRQPTICTHSIYTQSHIRKIYGKRADLCHYGIDTNIYRPQNVPPQNMVLSVGAIAWIKGHEDAIRAISQVPSHIRPSLVVAGQVGTRSEVHHLTKLAQSNAVELNLLVDSVSLQQLLELYSAARLLLCLPYREPFGLTPLESMACGTPVVAVNEGGLRETVLDGQTGYLAPRDYSEIARLISKVLTGTEQRHMLGSAGRSYVAATWTWQRAVDEITHYLMEAANKAPHAEAC